MKAADFVLDSRVGAVDRGLGFLYGAARGLLLMVVAQAFFLWLAQTTPGWMAQAKSKPILESLGNQLMDALPQDLEAQVEEALRQSWQHRRRPQPGAGRIAARCRAGSGRHKLRAKRHFAAAA